MDGNVKKKILVVILEQGWIRPEVAPLAARMSADERYNVSVKTVRLSPSEDARNSVALDMLKNGFDYLIMIDDDVIPKRNPLDLVELGLDVVGFAVPQWNMTCPEFPIYFVGMDKQPNGSYAEHKNREGLQRVDAVGSGCLLMSRRVLENVRAPFMRRWSEDGIAMLGLDFLFCEKAIAAGFPIYCHYDFQAEHVKELKLLEVLEFKLNGSK